VVVVAVVGANIVRCRFDNVAVAAGGLRMIAGVETVNACACGGVSISPAGAS